MQGFCRESGAVANTHLPGLGTSISDPVRLETLHLPVFWGLLSQIRCGWKHAPTGFGGEPVLGDSVISWRSPAQLQTAPTLVGGKAVQGQILLGDGVGLVQKLG